MRRSLGTLLLLAALAACGSGDGRVADPGATPEPLPASTGPGAGSGWTQVALLSASDVGGEVAMAATPLPDDAAVGELAGQLGEPLAAEVVEAARVVVPDGQALYGAVVAIGCQAPSEVRVTRSGSDVLVTPRAEKPSAPAQCRVPVTTVALVLVEQ